MEKDSVKKQLQAELGTRRVAFVGIDRDEQKKVFVVSEIIVYYAPGRVRGQEFSVANLGEFGKRPDADSAAGAVIIASRSAGVEAMEANDRPKFEADRRKLARDILKAESGRLAAKADDPD